MKRHLVILVGILVVSSLNAQLTNRRGNVRSSHNTTSVSGKVQLHKTSHHLNIAEMIKSAGTYQLDSMVGEFYKEINTYDESGRHESISIYEKDYPEEDFYYYLKEVYTYTDEGRLFEIWTYEDYDGVYEWELSWVDRFSYDSEGNIDTMTYLAPDGASLIERDIEVYYYSPEGLLDSIIDYELEGGAAQNKNEFEYDGSNRLSSVTRYYAETSWDWTSPTRTEFTYTTNGKYGQITTLNTDIVLDDLFINYVETFVYNVNDVLTSSITQYRPAPGDDLEDFFSTTLGYVGSVENATLLLPLESYENYPTYFFNDMPTSITDEEWDGEAWVDYDDYILHYSQAETGGIGSGIKQYSNNTLTFTPNPATNSIFLISDNVDINRYAIYDIYGRTVQSERNFKGKEIEVSHLPSGIFYLSLFRSDGNVHTEKLIKR